MSPRGDLKFGSRRDGFIIVAVMWILIALASLATIYSAYVANSAMALSVNDDNVRAEALVSAALELAAYQCSTPTKDKRPPSGAFSFRMGAARITVSYVVESARIDLNAAPKPLLAGLFMALGAGDQQAAQYADRIDGWRMRPKPNAQDNEDGRYLAAGVRYPPRGAAFPHVNELWLVHGLPSALVERALNFVTVYSGKPTVNVLVAAPEVIAALPGMTPGRLNAFLGQRESLPPDPQFIAGALGSAQDTGAGVEISDAIRVNVRVNFDQGQRTATEAVILVGRDDAPLRILSWNDDTGFSPDRMIYTQGAR